MSSMVIADTFEMDSREIFSLSFDISEWLAPGDILTIGTSVLIRISDGLAYTAGLSGIMSVSGQTLSQTVTMLEAGQSYWLIQPCTTAGRTFAPRLKIVCPRI